MSDVIHSAVIEVGVDAGGVDAGLAKVEASVAKTGRTLKGLGKDASEGFDKVGTAADKLDTATKRTIQSIERQTIAMGKSKSEYYAAMAAVNGNSAALSPYIAKMAEAERATAKAGNSFGDMATKARTALSALGIGLSVAAFYNFGKAALTAASEAEQASARIVAVLKATASASGITRAEIDSLADSMATSTQFDDEAVRNAAAELLKYRDIQGQVFKDAMAVSADYAAYSGKSIQDAASEIGKGLANVESASRLLKGTVGELTDSEATLVKGLLETGRGAEAQQVILDKLRSSFAGAAAEMNSGINKSTKELGKSWGEFLEAFGKTDTIKNTTSLLTSLVGVALDDLTLKMGGMTDELSRLQRTASGKIGGPAYVSEGRAKEQAEKTAAAIAAANYRIKVSEEALVDSRKKAGDAGAKAYDAIQKKAAEYIQTLAKETEQVGLNAIQRKMVEASLIATTLHTEKERMAVMSAAAAWALKTQAMEDAVSAAKENNATFDLFYAADEAARAANESGIKGMREKVEAIEEETLAMTLNAAQLSDHIVLRELEKSGLEATSREYVELKKRMEEAYAANSGAKIAKEANEAMSADWKKTVEDYDDVFRKGFADMVNNGTSAWKSFTKSLTTTFKTTVADQIYKMFAQPFVVKILASLIGVTGGAAVSGMAGAADGGSSWMSAASNAQSAYNLYNMATLPGGAVAGGSLYSAGSAIGSSSLMGYGAGVEAASLGAVGSGATVLGAADAAAGTAAFAEGAAAASSGVGAALAAIPVYGWVALGALALYSAFGQGGETTVTGQGINANVRGTSASGNQFTNYNQDGGWFGSDTNWTETARVAMGDMFAPVRGTLLALSAQTGKDLLSNLDTFSASYHGASEGLNDWIKQTSAQMIESAVPYLAVFRRAGEDTFTAVQRLYQLLDSTKAMTASINGQIAMIGGVSQSVTDMVNAGNSVDQLMTRLAQTTDIQTRIEMEGQLSQLIVGRYEAEKKYLEEIGTTLQAAMQTITDARIQVTQSAALINPANVMGPNEIKSAIASASAGVAIPSLQGIYDAQAKIGQTQAARDVEQARINAANAEVKVRLGGQEFFGGAGHPWDFEREFNDLTRLMQSVGAYSSASINSLGGRNSSESFGLKDGYQFFLDGMAMGQNATVAHSQDYIDINGVGWGRYAQNLDIYKYKPQGYASPDQSYTQAIDDAKSGYALAQDQFAEAMTQFAADTAKVTERLSALREETMRYYAAQKQLAELMNSSASGLRESVRVTRMGQTEGSQSLAQLQNDFQTAYSMALSTEGAAKAGYADKLAAALPDLSLALMDTAGTRAEWVALTGSLMAQSETIAAQLEASAPQNYASDSLAMLGTIDAALVALASSTTTAEQMITDAIKTSGDKTVAGLRAVVAAISGDTIPAFASGGSFGGGLRIVGENGPELEATGPARIFNAGQLRGMLGGNEEMVQELRSLREEVRGLRAEAQATAGNTSKTARLLDRAMPDGDALATRVAA